MLSLNRLVSGLVVGPVTAAILGIAYLAYGGALFSPGPLNSSERSEKPVGGVQAHAELARNCAACHAPPWSGETMADRCQNCHANIRQQIEAQLPLHGKLTAAENCRTCHSEHNGPLASLTSFAHFDHNCTAFPLTGKHAAVACAKCHQNNAYQGTTRSCVGCHAEPTVHRGKFGLDCAQCHGTNTWKSSFIRPELMASFDHDRTGFKLTGAHKSVACRKCHVNETFQMTTQSCVSCHADPVVHRGQFGLDCAKCHSTTTWKGVSLAHAFPLNHGGGPKTASKACNVCHTNLADYKQYTCYGCHKHDPEKTAEKHLKKRIVEFQNCFACHPTGREKKNEPPKHPLLRVEGRMTFHHSKEED